MTPPTPDPALGLFETLLVAGGEPVELGAHLARLADSLGELYGIALPEGIAARVRAESRGLELGRLRVNLDGLPASPRLRISTEPVDPAVCFPGWEDGVELASLTCAGGVGRHKWFDRRRLEAVPAGKVALLFDRGDVLEASRANLFAVFGASLATPPLDGRILPGITRAGAIAVAREAGIEVVERPLRRTELPAADAVFLTGSVRGVEPARSLDGEPLGSQAELREAVAAGLRRRWLGTAVSRPGRRAHPAAA